jgi:nucleoside-diphosphate kinase
LVLVKPDGVQRGLIGEIIGRFERRGLKLIGLKLMRVSAELAARHYAEHEGKSFYPGLISFITSGPVVAMAWQGPRAIELARQTMGDTRPWEAKTGSVRADYGLEVGRNLVHGADRQEAAARELALFFDPAELIEWDRDTDRWFYEMAP